jgi:transcriptional regulator with XRE-family HTH domain
LVRGFTQEEVASKLCLSLKAYQNIEHGITKIDLERIKQLAAIFDISENDLIGDSELKIRFEEVSIYSKEKDLLYNKLNSAEFETYNLLLKEKDNEIIFLQALLNKLLTEKVTPKNCDSSINS